MQVGRNALIRSIARICPLECVAEDAAARRQDEHRYHRMLETFRNIENALNHTTEH